MSSIEAVIFDVDGTLVDTSEFITQAYEHALQLHGLSQRSRADIESQVGKKLEDCYAFLAPNAEHALLIAAHRQFQSENPHLIQPFAYAGTLLEHLHNKNRRLALFTSRKDVLPSLRTTGIDPALFDVVVDGSMVEKGKPDPEGLYQILGELSLKPSQVIMVGDAGADIEVGKRAKVRSTIGITHGFGTKGELQAANADYIIDSLTDLLGVITRIEHENRSQDG